MPSLTPIPPLQPVAAAFHRELAAMRAEVAAYPSDESLFVRVPGLPNSGGNLALHCAGNLRHFLGAALGGGAYVRDRAREFSEHAATRAQVDAELAAAVTEVAHALTTIRADQLDAPWPGALPAGAAYTIRGFLQHLTSHLAYHLGQLDYHRRLVTGNAASVGAMDVTAMSPQP